MKHSFLISIVALVALSCQEDNNPAVKNTYSITVQIGDGQTLMGDATEILLLSHDQVIATGTGPLYTFTNLEEGESYTVIPQPLGPGKEGLTSLDIFKIEEFIQGNIQLNPFEQLAADVNLDNAINQEDIDVVRNCIIGSINCPAWRFATTDFDAAGAGATDQVVIPKLFGNQSLIFMQVKLGDINCTLCPG